MPYIGQAGNFIGQPGSHLGNLTVTGNIKSGGQLTANDTLFKMIMDTAADLGDNFLIEDGGTDGSGTNAGDDICLEKDLQVIPAGDIISISGVAGAAPSWTFVSSVTISDGDAAVAFTNMEDGYDYKYRITGLIPVTDNADPSAFLGVAGPTYRTAGYRVTSHYRGASGTSSTVGTDTATIMLDSGMGTGSVSDEQLFVILELYNPANSGQTNIKYEGTGENSNAEHIWTAGWGWYDTDEAHTSLQIKSSSGNLEAGIIYQYRRPIVFS